MYKPEREPMKICTVEEMRNLDQLAVKKHGIIEEILMENAGLAAFLVIAGDIDIRRSRIGIFCGSGNNGGDGLVVARKLHSMGITPSIYLLGNPKNFKNAARRNYDIISSIPVPVVPLDSIQKLRQEMDTFDLLVDAIFGTGLTRDVEGLYREVVQLLNESGKRIVSLDIPSGTCGDTGRTLGISIRADKTVTFGLPKIGNLLYPGYGNSGELTVTHISFPAGMTQDPSAGIQTNCGVRLPERQPDGHKGSFGDVLFIAGSSSYYGAPLFSALSFLKTGGGYSRLAAPSGLCGPLKGQGNEIVYVPMEETPDGGISQKNLPRLLELSQTVDMVVLGPGLSLGEEPQELARQLCREINKPLLIDGDGITAIAEDLSLVSKRKPPTVLTPHLGEMSRLCGKSIADIDKNKVPVLQETSIQLNSHIVMKGAHSLIGTPSGTVYINLSGNSGMATAGSGDVLTGTIAAMFGLGQSVDEGVRTGTFIHGMAGDLAAEKTGEDGITAGTILNNLPEAVRTYRSNGDEIRFTHNRRISII